METGLHFGDVFPDHKNENFTQKDWKGFQKFQIAKINWFRFWQIPVPPYPSWASLEGWVGTQCERLFCRGELDYPAWQTLPLTHTQCWHNFKSNFQLLNLIWNHMACAPWGKHCGKGGQMFIGVEPFTRTSYCLHLMIHNPKKNCNIPADLDILQL